MPPNGSYERMSPRNRNPEFLLIPFCRRLTTGISQQEQERPEHGHYNPRPELGDGTPNSLKYGIHPYGLVVLMIIVITEAALRIDSKYF